MIKEFTALYKQTWPMLVSQFAVIGYGLIDTIMVGRVSTNDLAAMSVAMSVYITSTITFISVLFALSPFLSKEYGAKNFEKVTSIFIQGIWLALFLSVLSISILSFPGFLLKISNLNLIVEKKALEYLHAIRWAIPSLFLFRAFGQFTMSISKPKITMILNFIGLGLNVILNDIFIFGVFGMKGMGVKGSAVSTAICAFVVLMIVFVLLLKSSHYKQFYVFKSLSSLNLSIFRNLLRVGIPIGLVYFIDYSVFSIAGLFVARLGTVHASAYHISCHLSVLIFMIPLSIGNAACVLIAQAIGKQETTVKLRKIAIFIGIFCALLTSFFIYINLSNIILIYTKKHDVSQIAFRLISVVVIYHVFDSILTIITAILRAYKKTFIPLFIYGSSLWVVGLLGGYILCFQGFPGGTFVPWLQLSVPLKSRAFWLSNTLSTLLSGIAIYIYYRYTMRKLSQTERI